MKSLVEKVATVTSLMRTSGDPLSGGLCKPSSTFTCFNFVYLHTFKHTSRAKETLYNYIDICIIRFLYPPQRDVDGKDVGVGCKIVSP